MKPEEKLALIADTHSVRGLCRAVLDDDRFPRWSGSSRPEQHHYGDGGLAQHTLEVVELCLQTNNYYGSPVPPAKLVLAGIFHDAGKLWDYRPKLPDWEATEHKTLIHHISRSVAVWLDASRGLSEDWRDEIWHAILSHHGLREWGSPVKPQTKLAWILHLCDGISARVNECPPGG